MTREISSFLHVALDLNANKRVISPKNHYSSDLIKIQKMVINFLAKGVDHLQKNIYLVHSLFLLYLVSIGIFFLDSLALDLLEPAIFP